jgi:hypothetical protein
VVEDRRPLPLGDVKETVAASLHAHGVDTGGHERDAGRHHGRAGRGRRPVPISLRATTVKV